MPSLDASSTLLPAIATATREAGALALAAFRGEFRSWDKAPGELVSEVDLAVDALLKDRLAAIDPHAGWLSEETVDTADRLAKRRVWVVDPIDGTRDFVRGRPGWCVSVALVEDGRVIAGVLDAPARDEHYTASLGGGVTLNGCAIAASTRAEMAGARVPADVLPRGDRDLVAVPKPNTIELRIALVARGAADLVAATRWGNEWDLAAAALIAAEAGATVSDANGAALRFNTPAANMYGVIACAPALHPAAVARLAK